MTRKKYLINISIEPKLNNIIDQNLIKSAAQTTFEKEGEAFVSLSIMFTTDDKMRYFNRTYRNIDQATDVLAFNQDYIDPETELLYLGDIIISWDRAKFQAEENNRSVKEELALLTIHGILHLLGYDHAEPGEKRKMWDKQNCILRTIIKMDREGRP